MLGCCCRRRQKQHINNQPLAQIRVLVWGWKLDYTICLCFYLLINCFRGCQFKVLNLYSFFIFSSVDFQGCVQMNLWNNDLILRPIMFLCFDSLKSEMVLLDVTVQESNNVCQNNNAIINSNDNEIDHKII